MLISQEDSHSTCRKLYLPHLEANTARAELSTGSALALPTGYCQGPHSLPSVGEAKHGYNRIQHSQVDPELNPEQVTQSREHLP